MPFLLPSWKCTAMPDKFCVSLRLSPSFSIISVKVSFASEFFLLWIWALVVHALFHTFVSAGAGFEKIQRWDTGYAEKHVRDGGMKVPYCAPSLNWWLKTICQSRVSKISSILILFRIAKKSLLPPTPVKFALLLAVNIADNWLQISRQLNMTATLVTWLLLWNKILLAPCEIFDCPAKS